MSRTNFIEYQGVRIALLNFAGIADTETALAAIAEAESIITQEPPRSVLTLTDVTGSHFDSTIVKALRQLAEHDRPFVRAGAVVGLSGLMRVILSTLVHLTGRDLRAFDTLEEAKQYLVQAK